MGKHDVRGRDRVLAQRRRREGRAAASARHTRPGRDAVRDVGGWASGRRPASTSPTRSAGIVRDPAEAPWREIDLANGAFGQGVAVTPIQLATAYAAMVNGGDARPAARRASRSARRETPPIPRAGDAAKLSATLVRMMRHVVTEVDFYRDRTLHPGLRRSAARPAPPRSGTRSKAAALEGQHVQLLVRRLHRREKGQPDLVVAVRIEEGTPTVIRARATSRCRSCRSSCSGASPTTRSRPPTSCPTQPVHAGDLDGHP